jgi:hypothetical protein
MIDRESVRNHHKRYRKGGLLRLLRHDAVGSEAALNSEQCQQLADYLQTHLFLTAKQVAHYVQQTWNVTYSESGIRQRLHRLGFVYKKTKLIPGKILKNGGKMEALQLAVMPRIELALSLFMIVAWRIDFLMGLVGFALSGLTFVMGAGIS